MSLSNYQTNHRIRRVNRLVPTENRPEKDSKSFLDKTESIIKLLGTAATVVALFGYPAICYQLIQYDLPLQVISYKNILYAGIIPSLFFFIFLLYGYKVSME